MAVTMEIIIWSISIRIGDLKETVRIFNKDNKIEFRHENYINLVLQSRNSKKKYTRQSRKYEGDEVKNELLKSLQVIMKADSIKQLKMKEKSPKVTQMDNKKKL